MVAMIQSCRMAFPLSIISQVMRFLLNYITLLIFKDQFQLQHQQVRLTKKFKCFSPWKYD